MPNSDAKTLINAEKYPVSQLCVNTLLATKFTLIIDGIQFGRLRINPKESKCSK
jgi:hypothetical protein